MATTCKLIAKNVLGSNTATVTFSSIPSTYTDLLLLCSARTARAGIETDLLEITFNNDTASSRSARVLRGTGSTAASNTETGNFYPSLINAADSTASTFANVEIYIPNYGGSTNKSFSATGVQEHNATAANIRCFAGLWSNTAAISSVELFSGTSNNFVTGSSFFLYGITKA